MALVISAAITARSVVGGGKFANGAQTGAFRYLFNESMHDDNAYVSGYMHFAISTYFTAS
jgi:hypothetical protein